MTCFVKQCKNARRLLPSGSTISFHRFPKKEELFRQWLSAIGEENESISWRTTMYICSAHFNPEDIDRTGNRSSLKRGVIPSRNMLVIFEKQLSVPSTTRELAPQKLPCRTQSFVSPSAPKELSPPKSSRQTQLFALPSTSRAVSPRKLPGGTQIYASPTSTQSSPVRRKRKMSVSTTSSEAENPLYEPLSTGWVSSDDSSLERRRKKFKLDHPYATSPGTAARKSEELKQKYVVQSKKLYKARESIKGLKRRVNSLKSVLNDLKSKHVLSTNAIEHLEKTFGDIPGALMSRMLKSIRSRSIPRSKYPEQLRKFAVTLHFYSSKAYKYVRNTFNLALPHPSVIRKWSSSIECQPGFSTVCLNTLKAKVEEAKLQNRRVICSLTLDEMSIKKQIDFDGKRNWGYVDVGIDLQHDEVVPASEALVLMVVSHNSSWKLPIAYFLIRSLSGAEKANIIREALIRLHEIGVDVTSTTCDGPTAHFSMFTDLGCDLKNVENLKTYCRHPSDKEKKVYAVFDICHMIKLVRNAFADLEVIIDPDEKEIKWEFVKKLHNVQEEETLSLANKLKTAHIQWKKQKMKVNLAAQTLSSSVAAALEYLCVELKHPQFQGCEATVKFIRIFNELFDLANSRLPFAKGSKGPLRTQNEELWRPFVLESIKYILHLKDAGKRFLWTTPKKTGFLGFVISLTSVMGIYDDYVKTKILSYFLTYKISQDHLELFFCAVRSRNGWNNNPSALQFMRTFRKLILHADVSGAGGNCRVLDTTTVLTVTSGTKKDLSINEIDISSLKRNNLNLDDYLKEQNYDVLPELVSLSEYCETVVAYIGGYVVKMLNRTVHCEDCLDLLTTTDIEDKAYLLIKKRNLGGLLFPSKGIIKICHETEIFIRKLMHLTDGSLPSQNLLMDIIINVSRRLVDRLSRLFTEHEEHHYILLKAAIHCYCKIRLHNLAKKYTEKIQGDLIRKKLSKLILFSHQ